MDAEHRLMRLVASQYHVFSRQQALDCLMTPAQIRSRMKRKLWLPLYRGVIIVAGVRKGPEQRIKGAELACGPTAAASLTSAAFVWDAVDSVGRPSMAIERNGGGKKKGIETQRPVQLEATTYRGFRVTTSMRTLVDLNSVWPIERVEKAFHDMHRRGLIDPRRFDAYLADKKGVGELRDIVRQANPDRAMGSDGQTVLLQIIRDAGLPLPVPEYRVMTNSDTYYIDLAYPEQRIALEVDGGADHARFVVFLDDQDREQDLRDLGWTFERFTGRQLNNPAKCATRVGIALGLCPTRSKRA